MKLLDRILSGWRKQEADTGPVIQTTWGEVTQSARRQAAVNMRNSPELRERVLALVVKEMGGDEVVGRKEFKRRYPEAGLE